MEKYHNNMMQNYHDQRNTYISLIIQQHYEAIKCTDILATTKFKNRCTVWAENTRIC